MSEYISSDPEQQRKHMNYEFRTAWTEASAEFGADGNLIEGVSGSFFALSEVGGRMAIFQQKAHPKGDEIRIIKFDDEGEGLRTHVEFIPYTPKYFDELAAPTELEMRELLDNPQYNWPIAEMETVLEMCSELQLTVASTK